MKKNDELGEKERDNRHILVNNLGVTNVATSFQKVPKSGNKWTLDKNNTAGAGIITQQLYQMYK